MRHLTSLSLCLFLSCMQVLGYDGEEELGAALKGSNIVIIPAGVPRKPGASFCFIIPIPCVLV